MGIFSIGMALSTMRGCTRPGREFGGPGAKQLISWPVRPVYPCHFRLQEAGTCHISVPHERELSHGLTAR